VTGKENSNLLYGETRKATGMDGKVPDCSSKSDTSKDIKKLF
jgi:hypothetical protein